MLRSTLVILAASFLASALPAQSATYVPSTNLPNGRQILAVYLGADSCGPCHSPAVKDAVELMKILVRNQARQTRASFAAVGVANDWDLKVAASFIAEAGSYDQVVLGGNFTNLAIEQFVWRDPNGRASMPQIIIVERTVLTGQKGISISEPQILRRIVGADSIPAWVKQGALIATGRKQ